jgi:endonuclease III
MVATAVRFEHMPARTGEKVSLPSAEMNIETLAKTRLYSEELEIDLRAGNDKEIFKWFLASLLFGARITETIAKNTYRAFERNRLLDPKKILGSGWEFLVSPIMSEGGYVRYDGRKSTQILRDCEWLLDRYEGRLTQVHRLAKNSEDLEHKLLEFYGVGEVTANIFLRELRPYWKKADPEPLPIVKKAAERWGIDLVGYDRKTLRFCRIEAGLIRSRRLLRGVAGVRGEVKRKHRSAGSVVAVSPKVAT